MSSLGNVVLVVDNNDGWLTCIEVGKLLGRQQLHIGQSQGKYIPFPDGKTLTEMMQDPVGFSNWFKEQGLD